MSSARALHAHEQAVQRQAHWKLSVRATNTPSRLSSMASISRKGTPRRLVASKKVWKSADALPGPQSPYMCMTAFL